MAIDAFNLAEKYQCPVYLVSEQALCQSKATLPLLEFDGIEVDRGKLVTDPVVFGEYRRFAFTDDGVSPRVIPGVEGGMHLAPGSEHNDMGVITENANNRKRMMEKRFQKLNTAVPGSAEGELFSNPRRARRAHRLRLEPRPDRRSAGPAHRRAGSRLNFLQLRTLWPFPDDESRRSSREYDHVFVVENSYTGQLARLDSRRRRSARRTCTPCASTTRKPFRPIEIIEAVEQTAQRQPLAGV